ncbi:MAG: S-layer homology domain-containing protein, partial [Actinomycetota bacterium]
MNTGERCWPRRVRAVVGAAVLLALLAPGPRAEAESSAAPADEPMSVGVVGDSILNEAAAYVDQIVGSQRPLKWRISQHAVRLDEVSAQVVSAVQGPNSPDILVLVIGTAQVNLPFYPYESSPPVLAQWRSQLDGLLTDVAGHVECVRVFEVQERITGFYLGVDQYGPALNAVTHDVVDDHPHADYFHYAQWTNLTAEEYDFGDHLHHNAAGQAAVARMVAKAADGCDPATAGVPFWDVGAGHWAGDAIAWLGNEGLALGYDNGSFRGEIDVVGVPISRAQVISMLWRHAGSPVVGPHPWWDGPAWIADALGWAAAGNVLSGWPDGTVRPYHDITRAEMARMIWRLAGSPAAAGDHPWPDGQPWVDDALDWVAEQGLMTGYPDGSFRPSASITRSEAARLLYRFDQWLTVQPAGPETAPATTVPPLVEPVQQSGRLRAGDAGRGP